jgi:hypothetical protein
MIIKFQSKEKWVIFGNVEQVEFEKLGNDFNKGGTEISCYEPPAKSDRPAEEYNELIFSQGKGEGVIIHAYSPIYLMNDDGKTVEII